MLTFEDCLGLCDCDEEEILAIAEHEHLPEMVALELSEYLVKDENGVVTISHMIVDDIRDAQAHGNDAQVERLQLALKHFLASHGNDRDLLSE